MPNWRNAVLIIRQFRHLVLWLRSSLGLLALSLLASFIPLALPAQAETAQVTVLYDAFGKDPSLHKDWGFAAYIEYGGKKILFDTGNNSDVLESNVRAKGIDLSKLDFAVISHRHGDHIGGLNYLLMVNPSVKIYVPQENFGVFGAALTGTFYRRDDKLPADMRYFDGSAPERLTFGTPWPKANFTWVTKTTEVAPGMFLTILNGTWGVDLEVKEISLAIDTPDGTVVVVGCSHPTIEKVVEAAKEATGKPVHLVIGGLHLVTAKDEQIKATATALHDTYHVDYVAPAHCTGEPAFAALQQTFGDNYVYAGLGTTVLFGPQVTIKADAGTPVRHAMDSEDLQSYRQALKNDTD
jgi:7,8-dihydropterin-6-yl-methyl-4-(beta-D-ribofuranosyl)aminobenzene 5'-phosphate synthase